MTILQNIYKNISFTIRRLLFFILIIATVPSFGQNFKEEKRIYVLDITGSMWGAGNADNIFDEVKNNLIDAISALDNPSTNITVITFGKQAVDKWEAKANIQGKKEIISNINGIKDYENQPVRTATNICAALEAANNEINLENLNYLFLYTDGGHNYPSTDLTCVKSIVQTICAKNARPNDDVYPFYIMLTEKANSKELREALGCMKIILPGEDPTPAIVRPESNRASINLLENKLSFRKVFVSNRNEPLEQGVIIDAELEPNSYFSLNKTEFQLPPDLGSITVKLIPNKDISQIQRNLPLHSELNLSFKIRYNGQVKEWQSVMMQPDKVTIDVINKREKTVTISVTRK